MAQDSLRLKDDDRERLNAWIRSGTTPQRVARRARIVVLAAEGLSARQIARRLEISPRTAAAWTRRFSVGGPDALQSDAPGRGRKATVMASAPARVLALVATPPPARRWTIRTLAAALGISRASVHRALKARNITLV